MPTPQGAARGRIEGDVGVDPADRPLPTDTDDEVQYAGRIAGTGRSSSAHDQRARAAVAAKDTATLTQLRADAAVEQSIANTEIVLRMSGRCAQCGGEVARNGNWDAGEYVVISPFRHFIRRLEDDHPVRRVLAE